MPWLARKSPIALDVGSRQIKAVQLGWARGTPRLEAAACVQRLQPGSPLTAEECRKLAATLQKSGFSGRSVVAAVPGEHLLRDLLELPPASAGVPVEQLARMELGRLHNRAPDSFEMVCWELPPSSRPREHSCVLGSGCPHELADSMIDVLEAGGFSVGALDTSALSLVRACRKVLGQDGTIQAVLDMGWTSFRMIVLTCGVICYERILPETGLAGLADDLCRLFHVTPRDMDAFLQQVTRRLACHEASPTATESKLLTQARERISGHFARCRDDVRATFEYVMGMFPGTTVRSLLLTGGGAVLSGTDVFAGALSVQTQILRPAGLLPCGRWEREFNSPAMVAALGLAQFQEGQA